jgi:hypothetical protein
VGIVSGKQMDKLTENELLELLPSVERAIENALRPHDLTKAFTAIGVIPQHAGYGYEMNVSPFAPPEQNERATDLIESTVRRNFPEIPVKVVRDDPLFTV